MVNSSRKLGTTLGNISQEQDEIKQNLSPNESDANAFIFIPEQARVGGYLTATAYYFPTDSFIIDHPVYGDIDSSTLKIDGGYAGSSTNTLPLSFPLTFTTGLGSSSEILLEKEI